MPAVVRSDGPGDTPLPSSSQPNADVNGDLSTENNAIIGFLDVVHLRYLSFKTKSWEAYKSLQSNKDDVVCAYHFCEVPAVFARRDIPPATLSGKKRSCLPGTSAFDEGDRRPHKRGRRNRPSRITFSTVAVRAHNVIVGDHPHDADSDDYPPHLKQAQVVDIDTYEIFRLPHRRQRESYMKLSSEEKKMKYF